jgi:hypothetical protein
MLSRGKTIYDMDSEQRMRAVAACHEKLPQGSNTIPLAMTFRAITPR